MGGIEVALKSLPPELARNEAEMEGIRENYAIVAKLHHSAISGLRQLEVRSSMSRVSVRGHAGSSGTPAYMAPEQWEAMRQSAATDQYALAKDPAGRFPTCTAFVEALARATCAPRRRIPAWLAAAALVAVSAVFSTQSRRGAEQFAFPPAAVV